MENKVYIYNLEQAYFYIENRVRPIEVPQIHHSTGKIFFIFDGEETEEVKGKWCNRKH